MNESESIFRNEALTYKENSFIGDFTVSPPSILPFTLWCSFFIFLLIVFILLLSYTQRIPIKGHVIYKPAASEVISNYDGVVKKLYVEQNNKVKKGDVIATISRDTFYSNGSVNEKLLEISKSQILELEKQKDILLKEADNENENLIKMIEKKEKEIKVIKSVIKSETDNNLKLRNRMIHYQELFEKRIATEQEKINRENEYFNSITQLSLHQISLAKTVSEKQQIIIELDKISTQKKQLLMEIKHKESLLKQSVIGYSSQMEAHIVAPIDGVISIINIQYGQRISIGQAIAIVIPEKAKSYVEMWLPPSALQEVKIGQSVLMRIESLPWQWFGKVRGKIELISKSPKKLSNDIQYFRLLIHFNNEIELPLGVNVEADILTRHRKVWQWIFYQQKNNINHIWDDN